MNGLRWGFLLLAGSLLAACNVALYDPASAVVMVEGAEGVTSLKVQVLDGGGQYVVGTLRAKPDAPFTVSLDGVEGAGIVRVTGEDEAGFPLHRLEVPVHASTRVQVFAFGRYTRLTTTLHLIFADADSALEGTLYLYAFPVSGGTVVAGPEREGTAPVGAVVTGALQEGQEVVLTAPLVPKYLAVFETATAAYLWPFSGDASWESAEGVAVLSFKTAQVE